MLTPKSDRPQLAAFPDELDYQQLSVSRLDRVIHVTFTASSIAEGIDPSAVGRDFEQLADALALDSRVLVDFEGVPSFCRKSMETLATFSKKLRNRGSRLVLCSLNSSVREDFYPARSPKS